MQRFALLTAATAAMALTSQVNAQLHYDTSTSSGLTPGAATWDVNNIAAWGSAAAPGTTLVNWTNGNTAFFNTGGTNTVTISGAVSAAGLNTSVASTVTSISGGTLTLTGDITTSGTGTTLTIGSGTGVTLGTNINVNNATAVTIGGIIGGGAQSLTKQTGTGTLTLSGANTYTGGTTVTAGTLNLTGGSNRLSTSGNITLATSTAVILDLGVNSQTTSGTVTLGRGTLRNGTLTSTTNAFVANASGMTVSAVLDGNVGLTRTGTGDLRLQAANTYTGTTSLGGTATTKIRISNNSSLGTGTLSFNGGLLELDSASLGTIANAMTAVSARNFLLSTSGANVYNATFSGNLTGDNTNGLIKTGTGGTITLSGTNTYAGNTTVSEGTLALGAIGQLKFLIGASGVNNTIAGVGTLNLNGSFLLDLASAGTTIGNSWNLVNVGTLTETFNTSFSVVGFTEVSNVWSQTIVPGLTQYEFSEGTGVLSVVVIPEPGMFGLIGVGVIGLLAGRRRRNAV